MSRTNQNDYRENFDGKSEDECIQRLSRRDRASERRSRVERGAWDVPVEPRSEKQMADRHVVAFGEDERQRDEW